MAVPLKIARVLCAKLFPPSGASGRKALRSSCVSRPPTGSKADGISRNPSNSRNLSARSALTWLIAPQAALRREPRFRSAPDTKSRSRKKSAVRLACSPVPSG